MINTWAEEVLIRLTPEAEEVLVQLVQQQINPFPAPGIRQMLDGRPSARISPARRLQAAAEAFPGSSLHVEPKTGPKHVGRTSRFPS